MYSRPEVPGRGFLEEPKGTGFVGDAGWQAEAKRLPQGPTWGRRFRLPTEFATTRPHHLWLELPDGRGGCLYSSSASTR